VGLYERHTAPPLINCFCHLTRDIPALVRDGGFEIEAMDSMYLPGEPRWGGFNYWGTARPR
jgi:hypothetical protein